MNTGKQIKLILATAARNSRLATAIAIVAILSMVLASSSQAALAQSPPEPGTIAGRVIQNTADVDFPEDIEVLLAITDPDGAVLEEIVKTPDSDGAFDFSEVEFTDTEIFTLYVEYGGIARTVEIETLEHSNNIQIDIWETTDSLESILIETQSTAVQQLPDKPGTIGILELIILRNDSDRTFLLPPDALILQMPRFGIPVGYRGLRVESNLPSGGVWNGDDGFAISNAIPPGQYQVMASYELDYVGEALDFSRPMPLGAEVVRFLVPPEIGRVNGTGLSLTDPTSLGGQDYIVFAGSGYAHNSDMTITLAGLENGSSATSIDLVSTGVPALIGVLGLALLAYAFIIRKRRPSATAAAPEPTRIEVLEQIADLDDLHEAGEINDSEHSLRRGELLESVATIENEADAPESRRDIVARIAELDERHESGQINDTEHSLRRQTLVERATELPDNA